jgi:hypothetical protein
MADATDLNVGPLSRNRKLVISQIRGKLTPIGYANPELSRRRIVAMSLVLTSVVRSLGMAVGADDPNVSQTIIVVVTI